MYTRLNCAYFWDILTCRACCTCQCAVPRSASEAKRMVGLAFSLFLVAMVFLGIGVIVPNVLDNALSEGLYQSQALDTATSLGYKLFKNNTDYPLSLDIYMFNCTNSVEVMAGAKPELVEVGPFNYIVYRYAEDVSWSADHREISWKYFTQYFFNRAKSVSDDSTVFVVPNLVTWGAASTLIGLNNGDLLNKAINAIYPGNEHDLAFSTRSMHDIVFGYDDDPMLAYLYEHTSHLIPSGYTGLITNYTTAEAAVAALKKDTIKTGYPHVHELRQYVKYLENDHVFYITPLGTKIHPWNGNPEKGEVKGSDGGAFPAPVTHYDSPAMFVASFYRSINLKFVDHSNIRGIRTLRFTMPESLFLSAANYEPNMDYNQITYDGILNITTCIGGVPLYVSRPRFAGASEEVLDMIVPTFIENGTTTVEGVSTYFDVEPRSGSTVNVISTSQVNVFSSPFSFSFDDDPWPFSSQDKPTTLADVYNALGDDFEMPASVSFQPGESVGPALSYLSNPTVASYLRGLNGPSTARLNDDGKVGDMINVNLFSTMSSAFIPVFWANQTICIGAEDAKSFTGTIYTVEGVAEVTPVVCFVICAIFLAVASWLALRGHFYYKAYHYDGHIFVETDNVDNYFGNGPSEGIVLSDTGVAAVDLDDIHRPRFRATSYDDIRTDVSGYSNTHVAIEEHEVPASPQSSLIDTIRDDYSDLNLPRNTSSLSTLH